MGKAHCCPFSCPSSLSHPCDVPREGKGQLCCQRIAQLQSPSASCPLWSVGLVLPLPTCQGSTHHHRAAAPGQRDHSVLGCPGCPELHLIRGNLCSLPREGFVAPGASQHFATSAVFTKLFNSKTSRFTTRYFSLGKQTENLQRMFASSLIISPEQLATHQVAHSD